MYKSPGGDPGSYTKEEKIEILLVRSVFLRCGFLLAQDGMPLACHVHDEDDCGYNENKVKKYFHASRIA
jgi:hypothetical protein